MPSNFDFLAQTWPDLAADARRAESYVRTDPRSSVFYARRSLEELVDVIYLGSDLPDPYDTGLVSRLADDGFQQVVGTDFSRRADLIRRAGNNAVHENRPITEQTSATVTVSLHELATWLHYRYAPRSAPPPDDFDQDLIPAGVGAPAISVQQLNQLAAQFAAADAQLAAERETNRTLQAQIAELQALVQANTQLPTPPLPAETEAQTRVRIDLQLAEAGWRLDDPGQVSCEYPLTRLPNQSQTGYADYVLWGADRLPLAVVEAKRTGHDPNIGQQQAKLYADSLAASTGQRPAIYYTNGYTIWLWDDAGGYPPRKVAGFASRDELELLHWRRSNRQPLDQAPINSAIVNRPYQLHAIRAIDAALTKQRRRALLVMATGTGKTRVAVALVEQLMNAGWAKRVLFLADRVALVKQAVNAFKTHLPESSPVNLVTDRANASGRVYVSTYPTMMGLIQDSLDGLAPFRPGYFDLVIIDEAHRSVYQKYGAIFEWFDSLLIGLTATPSDQVDRNTYLLFGLEDGVPTDVYGLDQATADGYLVPYRAVSVATQFLRKGIVYDDLSDEEKQQWEALDWGDGPPPAVVEPAALNKYLFNRDTVRHVLATLMSQGLKVGGGDQIGKTIIFAKNQQHAEFIKEVFDEQYPEFAGRSARVITHATSYAQSLSDDFSEPSKPPQIAISVDMLDTGIDVPEIVNLVFFKPVHSLIKFWQMVGRGTRLRPDLFGPGLDKQFFYIFDFCGNLEYFGAGGVGIEPRPTKSLGYRLFETRAQLLATMDETDPLRPDLTTWLTNQIGQMNPDNFLVRPHLAAVERWRKPDAWRRLSSTEASEVTAALGQLPSGQLDPDEDAKRFDLLLLNLQLALLTQASGQFDRLRRQVQQIASALLTATSIPQVAHNQELIEEVAGEDWWIGVSPQMLEDLRRRLRGLARYLAGTPTGVTLYTDFADTVQEITPVDLPRGLSNVATDMDRFRAKARSYLNQHADNLTLQKLRRNKQLTPADLDALRDLLLASGAGGPAEIQQAETEAAGLGLFVRSLIGLDRDAVIEAFGEFLEDTSYTASQIDFINLIINELTAAGIMPAERLWEPPFTDRAPHGPDYIFQSPDVDGIIVTLDRVRQHALPSQVS